MSDETVQIVVISDEDADLAAMGEVAGLERREGEIEEDFAILGAVLLIGAVLAAAKLVENIINQYRGGVQIDLNQKPPVIRRNHQLPYGWVVIVAADDTVKVETHGEEPDSLERIITAVLKLPVDATASVVEAAIKAAHPGAETQTPAPSANVLPTPAAATR
jgi:hypothetical protein